MLRGGGSKGETESMTLNRNVVAALIGGTALLVGGGTALAAAQNSAAPGQGVKGTGVQGTGDQGNGDRVTRCEARLARIAERRGVSVAQLKADVKARLTARVDTALKAGRISPELATKLKARIAQSELCKAPKATATSPGRGLLVLGALELKAVTDYLDLSPAQLFAQLPGTSLGALAEKQGKSVEGLEKAILAPAKARLAKAVQSGRFSQASADQALERLEMIVARIVEFTFPAKS